MAESGVFHNYLARKNMVLEVALLLSLMFVMISLSEKNWKVMMMILFIPKPSKKSLLICNFSNPKEYCLSTILGQGCILGQLGISHCTGFESPKLLISLGFLYGYEMDRIIVISQLFAVTKNTKFECFVTMVAKYE